MSKLELRVAELERQVSQLETEREEEIQAAVDAALDAERLRNMTTEERIKETQWEDASVMSALATDDCPMDQESWKAHLHQAFANDYEWTDRPDWQ